MKSERGTPRTQGKNRNSAVDVYQRDDSLDRIQGKYSPLFILLITIIGIAMAETIAMIVVYFERHLPYYQQVVIDAAVMTVIIFPILYFLSFRKGGMPFVLRNTMGPLAINTPSNTIHWIMDGLKRHACCCGRNA